MMSVGTVIISPIPTFRRPRKKENEALVGCFGENGKSMATSSGQSLASRILGVFFFSS